MSADLNYTLKRIVNGLVSDNHTVKRGYFLVTVDVLSRFKRQIDLVKLIKFVQKETRTSTTMKNPEIHTMVLGKMMCHSAIIDSQIYHTSTNQLNQEALNMILEDLIKLYKDHDFVKESLQTVFSRIISRFGSETQGFKVLEQLLTQLIPTEADLKLFIFAHSDNLSLFLTLKHAYLD